MTLLGTLALAASLAQASPPVAPVSGPSVPASVTTSPLGLRILGGASSAGRLWLWSETGVLASLRPGERDWRVSFDRGVIDAAAAGDGRIKVLRSTLCVRPVYCRYVVSTVGRQGPDSPELVLPGEREPVKLLASGRQLYVLTRTSVYALGPGGWRARQLAGDLGGEKSAILGHLTAAMQGTVAWIGGDAGEWGGFVQRLDLQTGRLAPGLRLGPATSIQPDPERADCVFVSFGLVHFSAAGQVDRLCGDVRTPVLVRHLSTKGVSREQTEPFFGLARAQDGTLWAVSPLGLSQVDAPARARTPLPELHPIGGVFLSYAAPGLVVVGADLNAGMSLSGSTPLLFTAPAPKR